MDIFNTYKKFASLRKTTGQKLIDAFNLGALGKRSIVIQKVMSSAKNIYIITYDSYYPNRIMTYNDLKRIKGTNIHRLKLNLDIVTPKVPRFSMPIYLYNYNKKFSTDSYIITRDLMGRERLRKDSLFESYKIEGNKLKLVESK